LRIYSLSTKRGQNVVNCTGNVDKKLTLSNYLQSNPLIHTILVTRLS
jgi:hypothetical protein